jgi:hypothetical protein
MGAVAATSVRAFFKQYTVVMSLSSLEARLLPERTAAGTGAYICVAVFAVNIAHSYGADGALRLSWFEKKFTAGRNHTHSR